MPGIFGILPFNPEMTEAQLPDRMLKQISHEKWYQSFIKQTRDFSAGAVSTVPFFSQINNSAEDDDYLLVIEGNGITLDNEIVFNKDYALAKDILATYRNNQDEFIHRMGGSFNIALFHKKTKTLHLFNDRLGFSYLYYYMDKNLFMFGPEVKTFLSYGNFDKTLNNRAIASFFTSNAIIGNDTFFENVLMLPPASMLKVENRKISLTTYWKPQTKPDYDLSIDEWVEKALELYRFSLKKRLPEDKNSKIIMPLTGGLDSRLQLELIRQSHENLFIFTHGESRSLDYKIAGQVARKVGFGDKHRLVQVDPDWMSDYAYRTVWLSEGQVNFRNSYLHGVAENIGPGAKTFINGIIGAHLSTGSQNFFSKKDMIPLSKVQNMRSVMENILGTDNSHPYFANYLKDSVVEDFQQISVENGLDKFKEYSDIDLFSDQKDLFINFNIGRRMMGTIDLNKYFFYDVLPLVDDHLFDLYLTIPPELKMGHALYQDIFKSKFPHLAEIAWANTGRNLYTTKKNTMKNKLRRVGSFGRYYISRLSKGKINIKNHNTYLHRSIWLRNNVNYRKIITDNFEYAKEFDIGIIDPAKLDYLMAEHDKGKDFMFDSIMKVTTFIIWHRLFINNENYLLDRK